VTSSSDRRGPRGIPYGGLGNIGEGDWRASVFFVLSNGILKEAQQWCRPFGGCEEVTPEIQSYRKKGGESRGQIKTTLTSK